MTSTNRSSGTPSHNSFHTSAQPSPLIDHPLHTSEHAGDDSLDLNDHNILSPERDYKYDDTHLQAFRDLATDVAARNNTWNDSYSGSNARKVSFLDSSAHNSDLHHPTHIKRTYQDDVDGQVEVDDYDDNTNLSDRRPEQHFDFDPSYSPPRSSTLPQSRRKTTGGGSRPSQMPLNYRNRFPPHSQAPRNGRNSNPGPSFRNIDATERANWRWSNIPNLDAFLAEVYSYYIERGIWSITLGRILNLCTVGFVVGFVTYLSMCVDYSLIPRSKSLHDIYIDQCFHKTPITIQFVLWVFCIVWLYLLFKCVHDLRRLWNMHEFFHHLLKIPDSDIQTVPWSRVVSGLETLRSKNTSVAVNGLPTGTNKRGTSANPRMDARSISSRLMRRDNYMIALIHQKLVDFTIPIPLLGETQIFTKMIEWYLGFAILDFVFDKNGQVRPEFLIKANHVELVKGLDRRIWLIGIGSLFCVPILAVFLPISYFFRYFVQFRSNPGELGKRDYTPLANWMFRDYNQLWHRLERRKSDSYPFANAYLAQFPKDKVTKLCRFIEFVSGAFASVLVIASLLDPDLFLGFEVAMSRTVLFYIGVLTAIYATARSTASEDNVAFRPDYPLWRAINRLRYFPPSWTDELHTDNVRKEFSALYQLQIVIFLEELASIIAVPYILLYILPTSTDRLIAFFREFTTHERGLGYVTSLSVKGLGVIRDYKKSAHFESQKDKNRMEATTSEWKRFNFENPDIDSDDDRVEGDAGYPKIQLMMNSHPMGPITNLIDSEHLASPSLSRDAKMHMSDSILEPRNTRLDELADATAQQQGLNSDLVRGRHEWKDADAPSRNEILLEEEDEDGQSLPDVQEENPSSVNGVDQSWNIGLNDTQASIQESASQNSHTLEQTPLLLLQELLDKTTLTRHQNV